MRPNSGFRMQDVLLVFTLFVFSLLMTGVVRARALSLQLIAVPTRRGLHETPTPVGGGMAIVISYCVGLVFCTIRETLSGSELAVLLMPIPVAVSGLLDDRFDVDYRIRLAVQGICGGGALLLIGQLPALLVGPWEWDGYFLSLLLLPAIMIWLTNLYNFMDGIDGIAGSESAFVSLSAAIILFNANDTGLAVLCLCIFAGSCGFLVWNWPKARIFMGDVGSGFLGLAFGVLAVLSHAHGSMSLWSWGLLLAVFVVDATVTLVRRVISGQKWSQAHRQHAYQHLAVRFGHRTVTVGVTIINAFFLLPLAIGAGKHPEYGVYFALLGAIPLVLVALSVGAGKESARA